MEVKYLRASVWGALREHEAASFRSSGLLPVVINDVYIHNFFRPERIQIWYGGSGCFVPGTLVRTSTGLKPIESIQVGERVLSFDVDNKRGEYMPVLKTFRYSAVDIKQKFVTFVMPTYKIVCTANHEFYINGTWVAAGIIAQRIMEGDTQYERALLHQQQGKTFDNPALCNLKSENIQISNNETGVRRGGLPANNDFYKSKKSNGKNTQVSSAGLDRKPFGAGNGQPQGYGQDEQLGRKFGMDVASGEQRSLSKDGTSTDIQRRGFSVEQIKGVAGVGNSGLCKENEKGAPGNSCGKVRGEYSGNKGCSSSEELEARPLKIEEVVDVFFSESHGYVYDLCVLKNHNYCITGDNVIVHNSGKSDGKGTELLLKCLLNDYCRVMFVRKVHDTIRLSQFQLLLDLIKRYGLSEFFHVQNVEMKITCKQNGNMLFARGLDDVDKIKSIADVTDIWIEEPIDKKGSISSSDFTELNRRLRCLKATNHIHLTFNPISKDSWINDYFFKSNEYAAFTLKTTYLDNHFSPADQTRQFEILKLKKPEEYKVYALGEWGSLKQGLIYPEYSIITEFPEDCRHTGYGWDWGFYPDPWAMVKCGTKDGWLYMHEMFYENNHTSATRSKAMLSIGLPKSLKIIADRNPEAIAEMATEGWYNFVPAEKGPGSVKAGIDVMKGYKLAITHTSKNLKTELDNYSWAVDRRTGDPTGDPVDEYNHCFVAGTLVLTDKGQKTIESIAIGDKVLTEQGFKPVIQTHINTPTQPIKKYEIKTTFGTITVSCTINHKVKINGLWQEIGSLKTGDRIFLLKSSTDLNIGFTKAKSIIRGVARGVARGCTSLFGNFTTGLLSRGTIFTTKTNSGITTLLRTLRKFLAKNILANIQKRLGQTLNTGRGALNTLKISTIWQPFGIRAMQGQIGIGNTPCDAALEISHTDKENAGFAKLHLRQKKVRNHFVQIIAKAKQGAKAAWITLKEYARFAKKPLWLTSTKRAKLVEGVVLEVTEHKMPLQKVYDIGVHDCHNYTANGLLVHNCLDAGRYWVMSDKSVFTRIIS